MLTFLRAPGERKEKKILRSCHGFAAVSVRVLRAKQENLSLPQFVFVFDIEYSFTFH